MDTDMTSDSDKEGMLQRKNDLDEGGRKVSPAMYKAQSCIYILPMSNHYICTLLHT